MNAADKFILVLLLLLFAPRPMHGAANTPAITRPAYTVSEAISRRELRSLSHQAIFRAIQNDLAKRGVVDRGVLRPGDLRIQSSLPLVHGDPDLEVKRISFDPIRRQINFELWNPQEPQLLPFEVTARREIPSLGFGSASESGGVKSSLESSSAHPALVTLRPPVLARPGKPATLVMLGQNVRVTTVVEPLQPGIKGQSILVRDLETSRVMSAEVVDEGLLKTTF